MKMLTLCAHAIQPTEKQHLNTYSTHKRHDFFHNQVSSWLIPHPASNSTAAHRNPW